MCLAVSIEKYEKIFVSPFQFIKSVVIFTTYTCTRRHASTLALQHTRMCVFTECSGMEITGRFVRKIRTISTTTVVADTVSAEKVIRTIGITVQNYSAKLRSKRWFLMNFQAFLFYTFHSSLGIQRGIFWSPVLCSSTGFYRNNSFIHWFLLIYWIDSIECEKN